VIKRILAMVLSLTMAWLPAMGADQSAGQITAIIPAATRNAQPAKNKDGLQWNDLLQTTDTGRLRAGLTDGSILSLGSNSQLRVVQHDGASQQTSLEIGYGKLRSRVVRITQPNGKFEVKTPNAVIGVIGTDFYVGYENDLTTVICYVGQVSVIAQGTAKVVRKSEKAQSNEQQTTLGPGQMVVIGLKVPPAGFAPESEVIQTSMLDTRINPVVFVAQPKFWIPVVAGVVGGGIAAGIVLTHNGGSSTPTIPPPAVCAASFNAKCGK
jgi:FecR-like protein